LFGEFPFPCYKRSLAQRDCFWLLYLDLFPKSNVQDYKCFFKRKGNIYLFILKERRENKILKKLVIGEGTSKTSAEVEKSNKGLAVP
jgi:hypothetical protein